MTATLLVDGTDNGPDLTSVTMGRLLAAAPHILGDAPNDALLARGGGVLFETLTRSVKAQRRDDLVWLLIVAVTGAFPNAEHVRSARRAIWLAEPVVAHLALLQTLYSLGAHYRNLDAEIEIVTDGVVVDVDFCANHTANTGIQRVVRQTMSRWDADRDIVPVAWTPHGGAMRRLSPLERSRVVEWNKYTEPLVKPDASIPANRIVVPFGSAVILPEVPQPHLCDPLAALAEFSGNRVGLIGYDAIPIVSADNVPAEETERFVHYLTIIKHSKRVVGISAASTEDFRGFSDTLASQGLAPVVTMEVSLPVDVPDLDSMPPAPHSASPLILCVGSQEPRKNQDAVLFASEVLWREGLDFRVRFIGGGSLWFTRGFDQRVKALQKRGRSVEVWRGVKDSALLGSYAEAEFSIFPSLHEGYGLPVAESIAMGVPVVTTAYASTGEIAADGGCLLVDPRDDQSIVNAMRRLLTEAGLGDELRRQIAARPRRTWDDYARELWDGLVAPLIDTPELTTGADCG